MPPLGSTTTRWRAALIDQAAFVATPSGRCRSSTFSTTRTPPARTGSRVGARAGQAVLARAGSGGRNDYSAAVALEGLQGVTAGPLADQLRLVPAGCDVNRELYPKGI